VWTSNLIWPDRDRSLPSTGERGALPRKYTFVGPLMRNAMLRRRRCTRGQSVSHVLIIRYSNSAVTMSGIKQTMTTKLLRAPSSLGIRSPAAIVFSIFRKCRNT
jgi:hypothetical protein